MIYYYSEIINMAVKAYFYRNDDNGLQFEAVEAENGDCSILYSKDLENEAIEQLEKQTEEQRLEHLLATRIF